MNRCICPVCKSEETFQEQEWLGKELRYCKNCKMDYYVLYEIKEKAIIFKPQ